MSSNTNITTNITTTYKVLQADASYSLIEFERQCSELVNKGYVPCTTLFVNGYIVQPFYLPSTILNMRNGGRTDDSTMRKRTHSVMSNDAYNNDTEESDEYEAFEHQNKRTRKDKRPDWQRMMYS